MVAALERFDRLETIFRDSDFDVVKGQALNIQNRSLCHRPNSDQYDVLQQMAAWKC